MFIKLGSHRCREKVVRILGKRQDHYSFFRETGAGGCIDITQEEYEQIKDIKGVSKLRGPYDTIRECW